MLHSANQTEHIFSAVLVAVGPVLEIHIYAHPRRFGILYGSDDIFNMSIQRLAELLPTMFFTAFTQ